jgi:hypothetical protein
MNRKRLPRLLGSNFLLFAFLFASISFNKEILRPNYSHLPWVAFLTGSFPNFMAAYIISLTVANGLRVRKPKHESQMVMLSAALIFLVLTVEEIMPMWGASTHYDFWDIFASAVGSLCSILTYKLVLRRAQK